MRIAIAGLGRIGKFHARTLAESDLVDEVRAFDLDTTTLLAVSGSLGLAPAHSFEDLLAHTPDGLVISTPTDTHAPLISQAVAAGIPVFTEKPVSTILSETRQVLEEVSRTGIPVQVGFQRRFDSEFRRARAAVQAGGLGWLHTVRASTLDPEPPSADYVKHSGGLFRDCGIHDFDAVRWITGQEVLTAYAVGVDRGSDFFAASGDVAAGSALLTLRDGTNAHVSLSRYNAGRCEVRMELLGSSAQFEIDRLASSPDFISRFSTAYRDELTSFIGVIRGEHPPLVDVGDALAAALISDACELSRAQGRPVAVSDVDCHRVPA